MNGAGVYLLPLSSPPPPPPPLCLPLSPASCCISRAPRCSKLGIGISDAVPRWRQWAFARARRGRADVKSESFNVSDSIKFQEALSEVVSSDSLLEEDEEEGEEEGAFSKRWLMVIFCSSAFLLCNMDRVNMSIAILPMSAEFNWNPATVGLIHSSFFWGYLLTQIAGGIWADTVGGKRVLGFGVVWWSVATAPYCCKNWFAFPASCTCFHGNW